MSNVMTEVLHTRVAYQLSVAKWFIFLGIFSALSIVLPYACHQFGVAGIVFLPMHFAVLLAGMVMGMRGGVVVGLVSPLISYATSGMPPAVSLFPITVELVTYGVVAGFMFHSLKKSVLLSLFAALIAGRIVSLALVSFILGRTGAGNQFHSLFVLATPGLAIQIVLIPVLVAKITRFLETKDS